MTNQGLHHFGVATHNMGETLASYEDVLGFETLICAAISPPIEILRATEALEGKCLNDKNAKARRPIAR
jgi:hypothetical protein